MRWWMKLILIAAVEAAIALYFGLPFLAARGKPKSVHLPGTTSDGHYQIELGCDGCHTPFRGVENSACLRCHSALVEPANDSHPERLFTDPRNADSLAELDARRCVTCHAEHAAERTTRGGLTRAGDLCRPCHEAVADERPDHRGLDFKTCADTGCHNYHDNRALNEDFLAAHLDEPALLAGAAVLARPQPNRAAASADAPASLDDASTTRAWAASRHARGDVTCASCHRRDEVWSRRPPLAVCRECHEAEASGFAAGKHGMRPAAGLEAMTPALARRPMRADAADHALGCGTCHDVHAVDTLRAAVDGCLGCHADKHSRAYKTGPHFAAWQAEVAGAAPPGSGVSCATCHLPRFTRLDDEREVVAVDHDQNRNLRPTTKMLRSVCMKCHGVGFSLDALADPRLVDENFGAPPAGHLSTLDMVRARARAKAGKPD
jgi:predicted CXXCH cytochrome family protein